MYCVSVLKTTHAQVQLNTINTSDMSIVIVISCHLMIENCGLFYLINAAFNTLNDVL